MAKLRAIKERKQESLKQSTQETYGVREMPRFFKTEIKRPPLGQALGLARANEVRGQKVVFRYDHSQHTS